MQQPKLFKANEIVRCTERVCVSGTPYFCGEQIVKASIRKVTELDKGFYVRDLKNEHDNADWYIWYCCEKCAEEYSK
jgi:hypothetical protein